jgi:acetyl-CoA carboxylase biotin carboxylase subunit
MVAKIIAHGKTRDEARLRLSRALEEMMLEGPATTVPLGEAILADERFIRGEYNTAYLESLLRAGHD